MAVVVTYGPKQAGSEIVSLERAKENSNIDHSYRDTLFQVYLDGIESEIENFLGAPVLLRENAEIWVNPWQEKIRFPFPVNEITGVFWLDENETETEITAYEVFANELTLEIDKPAGFKKLRILCSAGYDAAEIPADIVNAALLMFSERETYRENRPLKYNLSAQNILRPYKMY